MLLRKMYVSRPLQQTNLKFEPENQTDIRGITLVNLIDHFLASCHIIANENNFLLKVFCAVKGEQLSSISLFSIS